MKLTPKQARFVQEYLIDLNATQAALRAGYSPKTAEQIAYKLVQKSSVQQAIQELQSKLAKEAQIDAVQVLKQLQDIATTDPNEIVQVRRFSCRYCHGKDHRYQYTQSEYDSALAFHLEQARQAEDKGKEYQAFDPKGGVGFDPRLDPHEDCPECHGFGNQQVVIADTRKLSRAAKRLYAGAKKGRNGIEILLNSQVDALINIARHLGMFVDKSEVNIKGDLGVKLEFNEALNSIYGDEPEPDKVPDSGA